MDSPPTSRIRFRSPAGQPIAGPGEWQEALIEVDAAAERWRDLALWVQGQRLEIFRQVVDGKDCVLARWARSGPGRYRFRLRCGEEEEERLVEIAPRKLSPEAFGRLLEDLERRLPLAVALGLRRGGGLTGVTARELRKISLAEEVERLRCALEGTPSRTGLLAVLAQLARDPHRVLATTGLWVPRQRLRRPDPAGLRQALWRADNLDAERSLRRAIDLRVEPRVDVFENRLVKTFADEVERRLRRLADFVGERSPGPEVAELLAKLVSARRAATFLAEVSRLRWPAGRPTMVLMKRPAYRAAYEGYLDFHRGLMVLLDAEELEAPLENLPDLYELWCTLQVLDALLETATKLGWQVRHQRLVYPAAGGFYVQVLSGGEPLVRLGLPGDGGEVAFFAQRSYTAKGSPLRSLSYEQIPDVAVELTRPGAAPKVFLFDPKYKLKGEADGDPPAERPKKDDVDKMHAYRDAIRDAHGRRVVAHASILYPGVDVRFAPGLEALQAVPGEEQPLRARLRNIFLNGLGEL